MDPRPDSIFGFPVVQVTSKGVGSPIGKPVNIVLHTTETTGPPAYYNAEGKFYYPPHFDVSSTTIRQFRSLDQTASTLRHDPEAQPVYKGGTNLYAAQVEIIGYSKFVATWLPSDPTLARLVAVVAYMAQYHGVPLQVPNVGWRDDMSDLTPYPATRNNRRIWSETHWPASRGVYEHVEAPGQAPTYHGDCGHLVRTTVIEKVLDLISPPVDVGGDMSTLSQEQIDALAKLSPAQIAALPRMVDHLGAVKTVAGKEVTISGVLRGKAEGDIAGNNDTPLPNAWSGDYAKHEKDSWT